MHPQRPGFDIVLANPPYVKPGEAGSRKTRNLTQEAFPEVYTGMADLLVYFYARALQILQARRPAVFHYEQFKFMQAGYLWREATGVICPMSLTDSTDSSTLAKCNIFDANGKSIAAYPAVLIGQPDFGRHESRHDDRRSLI